MATLFTTVLAGIEDNNEINDASWNDWDDANHAIDTYGENFNGECSDEEMEHTIKALNIIIDSNGEKYQEAVKCWNISVWGNDFENNDSSVAFGG